MLNAQKIVDSTYRSAKDHKDKGVSIKRARTTLANLRLDDLEMSAKDKATIKAAIATLDQVAETYMKAHRIKARQEKLMEERRAAAKKLIDSSGFGNLSTIKDKVALISTDSRYRSQIHTTQSVWDCKYLTGRTFNEVLISLSNSLALEKGNMEDALGNAWKKFQDKLPELYIKNAVAVANIENILSAEATKS